MTIIGARPQFIKAATVSRILNQDPEVEELLVHTGQHYDTNMSRIFFDELEIPEPSYNLGIGGGGHGAQTGAMLSGIESLLEEHKPDRVLVYGDTNSTLAGALAAAKMHVPVAHVEAGLRSFNRKMPEEINRIVTDQLSDLLFTPTTTASQNLIHEGVGQERIRQVGDVMFDALLYYREKAEKQSDILKSLELESGAYTLVTIHRAENTDSPERLKDIMKHLEALGSSQQLVFTLHPRTRKSLEHYGIELNGSALKCIDPVGYLDMLVLQKNAESIITDSGGIQKEAYFNEVPCITLRKETEWIELVDLGCNMLSEPSELSECITKAKHLKIDTSVGIYGQGDAAQKIVKTLKR